MKKADKINQGFTLVEMIIAIFIIGVGLVGTLSFLSVNSANQTEIKNELIAAGLAQEGTELVRFLVDHSFANDPSDWYGDVYDPNTADYCKGIDRDVLLDSTTAKCFKKVKEKENAVCYDPVKAVYVQPNKNKDCPDNPLNYLDTGFTRTVVITGYDTNGGGVNLDTGDCLNVVSTVTWSGRTTKAADIICKPRQ